MWANRIIVSTVKIRSVRSGANDSSRDEIIVRKK